jgi:hypothetical protein
MSYPTNTIEPQSLSSNIISRKTIKLRISPHKLSNLLLKSKPKVRRRCTFSHLCYQDIRNKGPNWSQRYYGEALISSPIPILPKPLALQYVNYNKYYKDYKFKMTEREGAYYEKLVVGSRLASELLGYYFAAAEFKVVMLGYQLQDFLMGPPLEGVKYFLVLKKHEQTGENAVCLILAVITDPSFTRQSARTTPGQQLRFRPEYLQTNGTLKINNMETLACPVILLTGLKDLQLYKSRQPTRSQQPCFEFYVFDAGRKPRATLFPWFGRIRSKAAVGETNVFTLAVEEAEMVDWMFKAAAKFSLKGGLS